MTPVLRPTFLKTQRDASLHDERGKQTRLVLEFLQGIPNCVEEVVQVRRTQVAQFTVLTASDLSKDTLREAGA